MTRSFFLVWLLLLGACKGVPKSEGPIEHFVERVPTPRSALEATLGATAPGGDAVSLGQMLNLGERLWKIVERNRPVVTLATKRANALPVGVTSANELTGFSSLRESSYRRYGKNPYGAKVYDVTYTVVHRYGGAYHGHGHYLDEVGVIPNEVSALWGYHLDVNIEAAPPVNVGDADDPIADLTLDVGVRISTVIKVAELHSAYDLRGDAPEARELVR